MNALAIDVVDFSRSSSKITLGRTMREAVSQLHKAEVSPTPVASLKYSTAHQVADQFLVLDDRTRDEVNLQATIRSPGTATEAEMSASIAAVERLLKREGENPNRWAVDMAKTLSSYND